MSQFANDLTELVRLDDGHRGALIECLLRELAMNIIAPGVADERLGL
jgi:hypothetical protein